MTEPNDNSSCKMIYSTVQTNLIERQCSCIVHWTRAVYNPRLANRRIEEALTLGSMILCFHSRGGFG
jgi:hypothetical protein